VPPPAAALDSPLATPASHRPFGQPVRSLGGARRTDRRGLRDRRGLL